MRGDAMRARSRQLVHLGGSGALGLPPAGPAAVPGVGGVLSAPRGAERTGGHQPSQSPRLHGGAPPPPSATSLGGKKKGRSCSRRPCSCHARNRDGRGEREEQARREGANRGAFFRGHSLPNSILLRAFVMQCIERIGPPLSL